MGIAYHRLPKKVKGKAAERRLRRCVRLRDPWKSQKWDVQEVQLQLTTPWIQHPAAFRLGLEFSHVLAYAYQQVGRDDEANVLLTRVHEQLNVLVVEQNMDFGPLHHLLAQNFGLRGDFDAAADALEAAIKVGWLRYIWVMNDPTWAQTIADPRIARMLDDVKVELERQRAVVEQADAEHDFRAEFTAMRGAPGD